MGDLLSLLMEQLNQQANTGVQDMFTSNALNQVQHGGGAGGADAQWMQGPPQVNTQKPKEPLSEVLGNRLTAVGDALSNAPMWETQLQPFSAPYRGPAIGPAGFNPGEAALLALMQRIAQGGR